MGEASGMSNSSIAASSPSHPYTVPTSSPRCQHQSLPLWKPQRRALRGVAAQWKSTGLSCRRAQVHLSSLHYQNVQCPLPPRLQSLTLGSMPFWLICQRKCCSLPHLQRLLQPDQGICTEGEATSHSVPMALLSPVGSAPMLTERSDNTDPGHQHGGRLPMPTSLSFFPGFATCGLGCLWTFQPPVHPWLWTQAPRK